MKKYAFLFLLAFLFFSGVSCLKTSLEEELGTIQDFTGLDGCSLMIVLDTGKKLEPVSLPENTELIPDRRVAVKYSPVSRASICMAGVTAEIHSLRYL